MKEKLTLRNIVIWSAALLGLVFFFLSFAAAPRIEMPGEGGMIAYAFKNGIWGGTEVDCQLNGQSIMTAYMTAQIFALPLIGVILLLVAVIGAVLVSFLIKDQKVAKISLISCGGLSLVGGIFVFFAGETALRTLVLYDSGSLDNVEEYRQILQQYGGRITPGGLAIVIGIIAILAGIAFGLAPFLPEKKLAK